ncbi:MAG: hypothetical protein K0R05_311 [Anaerocolumna sp.]|jgi:hypothetical protein|nr:hypothetical protein [Anaerocolumna sp.]
MLLDKPVKRNIPSLEIPSDFNRYSKKDGNISYTSVYRKIKHTTHYIHPSLLYGYDDNRRLLKGIGFEESGIFTYLEYDYEEMQKAFINGKKY